MRYSLLFCAIAAVAAAGCAKHQTTTTTATSPAASATAPASPTPAGSPVATPANSAAPSAAPTATATATPAPNLLASENGTIVRAYPAGEDSPDSLDAHWFDRPENDAGPWIFVYELPGIATLSDVSARLPAKNDKGQGTTVTFAASTSGPDSGFKDIASVTSGATGDPQSASVQGVAARWIRVTVDNNAASSSPMGDVEAHGTLGPIPANAGLSGTFVQYDNPYAAKNGKFATAPDNKDPWYLRTVAIGNDVNTQHCYSGRLGDAYGGPRTARGWTYQKDGDSGSFVINDEGTLLVEHVNSTSYYWARTAAQPKYCAPQTVGKGSTTVAVLETRRWSGLYPTDDDDQAKGAPRYRFVEIGAPLLDRKLLSSASILVFNGLCDTDQLITPAQGQMIAQWVQAGHKLLIYDADMCDKPTHYAMLPYQFQSNNPGAQGAKGDRLILVEDNTLGTSEKTDKAHYFDPQPWIQNSNQLGDANTVTTQDSHWCGHLFGTNVNHVNGFMQMYANYGSGVIVYDGFDHDDGDNTSYQRVRMLELDQPIPADLPCTQQVSLAFLIEPNRTGKFVPGKAQTMTFPMELLANQGWKGHITIAASGDLKASVTPNSLDIAGGTKPLKVAVGIPANAKPGSYNVIVTGDGGNKQTAQATIQLTAAVPIVKQFQQKRIRLYGIHFDVDKATIKSQSEPVIAQIAAVMKQNPAWRFRVEGHTDSDGGYQHNMVLSQHRAEAVVNDLVKRYHIARSRLVPVGFGYSHPVAANTTAAGKALNRRVELVRL